MSNSTYYTFSDNCTRRLKLHLKNLNSGKPQVLTRMPTIGGCFLAEQVFFRTKIFVTAENGLSVILVRPSSVTEMLDWTKVLEEGWTLKSLAEHQLWDHKRLENRPCSKMFICDVITLTISLQCDVIKAPWLQTLLVYFFLSVQLGIGLIQHKSPCWLPLGRLKNLSPSVSVT